MTSDTLPVHLGRTADFQRVQSLLRSAEFDEATVCRLLRIDGMADLGSAGREELATVGAESAVLAHLVRLFLLGETVPGGEIDRVMEAGALGALAALGLIRRLPAPEGAGAYCASVLLYPVAGFLIASDRRESPDGSPFVPPPDVVFPAIFAGTLRFLRVLSTRPAKEALDLCSGTGIGAFALSRHVEHVVACDITARATHFAEFNRLLNGCENVEVVQGDLYEPVAGRTFDRIVAHPPYVPAFSLEPQVFRDAGETGETVLRRIIEGLPRHLRPGGTFECVSAAWDTGEGPLEQRIRGWLGDEAGEFDVIFAQHEEMSPEQVARWLAEKSHTADATLLDRSAERFREAGLERNVYGAIVLERAARVAGGGGRSVTVRQQLSTSSDGASFEWALRWYRWRAAREAEGKLASALLGAAPRLAPDLRVNLTYLTRDGELVPSRVMLETDRPFRSATKVEPWMLAVVTAFGQGRSARDVYDRARRGSQVPEGFGPDDFATLVALLVERGYLRIDGAALDL